MSEPTGNENPELVVVIVDLEDSEVDSSDDDEVEDPAEDSSEDYEEEAEEIQGVQNTGTGSPAVKRVRLGSSNNVMRIPSLVQLLECPICLDIPVDVPIFTCPKGHHLCGSCKTKVRSCPQCRSLFREGRNYGLEEIIKAISLRCKFEGCNKIFKGSFLSDHMKTCDFRPIQCNKSRTARCNGNGAHICLNGYLNHCIYVHKIPLKDVNESGSFTAILQDVQNEFPWESVLLRYDGQTFLTNVIKDKETVWMWISFLGIEADAIKYQCSLSLEGGQEAGEPRIYKVNGMSVHSHQNTLKDIQMTDMTVDCLSIDDGILKQCYSEIEDGRFKIKLTCNLTKVTIPASQEDTILI